VDARATATAARAGGSQLRSRLATFAVLAGFALTQHRGVVTVLLMVGMGALALPGIGPSGILPPARPGGADRFVAAAAVLVTWWLLTPAPWFLTGLAFGVAAAHLWTAGRSTSSDQRLAAWHAVRHLQYPLLILLGGVGLTTRRPSPMAVVLWVACMIAYPMVLHRSQVRAVTPANAATVRGRGVRLATALAAAALLFPLVLALVSAAGLSSAGAPAYGDPSDGDSALSYWGFGSELDTSTRGELPDTEVLRVRASRPDYWRAGTFDVWDGRHWVTSVPGGRMIPRTDPSGEVQYLSTGSRGLGRRTQRLEQTFRVVAGTHDRLYAAATPTAIETPGLDLAVQPDGTLLSMFPLGPGTRWTVTSTRPAVTPADLRAIGTVTAPEPVDGVLPSFGPTAFATQVPDEVPDRVRDLAQDITAGATTTYDQVVAIEAWLADNIEYTTLPPVPPPGADAVDQTLFVDRVGSCDQIASAFVILARAVSIPARLAVGFTAERFDAVQNEYVSLASNAHAWAEVWFGDVGWVGFDPTTDVPLAGEQAGSGVLWERIAPWVGLFAAVVAMGLLAWWGARRLVRWRKTAGDPHRRLRGLVQAFERTVAARTRSRRGGETLVAYARAVTPPVLLERSVALAEGLTDAAFGTAATDLAPLAAALADLDAAWERPPLRRRLTTRRRLTPAPA
jgi:transglutaminase-like putative cysteine protease